METAPRNCRFLSLVVVEHVLIFAEWRRNRAGMESRQGAHQGGHATTHFLEGPFRRFSKGSTKNRQGEFVGACAMTTKCLDNKICTFNILLSWRFPRRKKKQRFGRFASLPPFPSSPRKRKFDFYCRLAVSEL